jgi:hypothetical protein
VFVVDRCGATRYDRFGLSRPRFELTAVNETCGTAYLDGERHVCVPKSSALSVLGVGIAGVVGGGVAGFFLLTVIFCGVYGGNQCGLVGVFIGLPIGALIGGVAASIATRRGQRP